MSDETVSVPVYVMPADHPPFGKFHVREMAELTDNPSRRSDRETFNRVRKIARRRNRQGPWMRVVITP